jgi:antitoxin component of MazEF toxin-antitoxin module
MTELKVKNVGKGLGVELPQEIVEQLHLGAGDNISLEKMANGCYRLTSKSDELSEQMALIEGYMHEEDA